jgi:D-galactose 1-dehydrogenase
MLKIALIGLGHIAQHQIEAIKHVEDIEIVGAHDIVLERSSLLPSSVRFYETFDSLINNCGADLFMVSTPNKTHFEIGMNVLQKNRALIIEKPCSVNQQDLNALQQEIKNSGQFCAVALHASYALDLLWYTEQLQSGKLDYGLLNGFFSGFYDPNYVNGEVLPSAIGLGGSWLDSGINALSVIARLINIEKVSVEEGRMTVIDSLPCSEIQGAATLSFAASDYLGKGIIDTNWALGINRKRTHLYYHKDEIEVTLDHSNETVVIRQGNHIIENKNMQNGLPRLVNHYANLFRDVIRMHHHGSGNFDSAYSLHQILLDAHNYQFAN